MSNNPQSAGGSFNNIPGVSHISFHNLNIPVYWFCYILKDMMGHDNNGGEYMQQINVEN